MSAADTKSQPQPDVKSQPQPDSRSQPHPDSKSQPQPGASKDSKLFSKDNKKTARQFFSAYAHTWVGLSPIWLMGEALTPGTKVGTQFKKGRSQLVVAADEVSKVVTTSSRDIVVIVDQKLNEGKTETGKTAEVIKAAGENAILVVTSSMDKMQAYLKQSDAAPQIKKAVTKNGRDVVIIMDKALKHPLVVTGVAKFAKSKGIPHAEALLQLASLGLARIIKALPEENLEGAEQIVQEVDAAELERSSSAAETEQAAKVGKQGDGAQPEVKDGDPYAKMKRENQCVTM